MAEPQPATRPMQTEPFTEKQLKVLIRMIGMGAMIIDWKDIDFSVGRGVLKGNDRCLWNRDGRRIDVCLTMDGGFIVSQTKEPDPEYALLKKENS